MIIHTNSNKSDSPVVKRGWLLPSCAARFRGFSGRVREVEAGEDCARNRGWWTPSPLPTPPPPRSMGTARVSICRWSCCSCFCCSHSNDYRKGEYGGQRWNVVDNIIRTTFHKQNRLRGKEQSRHCTGAFSKPWISPLVGLLHIWYAAVRRSKTLQVIWVQGWY